MKVNNHFSDDLLKSLPKDQAVKYLNDLYVIQEVLTGIHENKDILQKDPESLERLYQDVLGRLDTLVHAYENSIVKAGLSYKVVVNSAEPLSDEMKEKILAKVEAQWGPNYLVNYVVDESLLGGIRLEVGEAVFDTTFKSRINQLVREV